MVERVEQPNGWYYQLYSQLVIDYGLYVAAVYGIVRFFCTLPAGSGKCFASVASLAERGKMGEKTVRRGLKALCQDGYLVDLTPTLRNWPHTYVLTDKLS